MKTTSTHKEYNGEYKLYIPKVDNVTTDNYQDSFLYWKSIEKLKQKQIEGNLWLRTKIWHFTITATGSKVITGVWFTPKTVQFFYTDQTGWSGAGWMDWTTQFWHDYMGSGSSSQTECIYLRDAGWTAICRATYTSFDSDWFTINVTTNTWTNKVDFIAFG